MGGEAQDVNELVLDGGSIEKVYCPPLMICVPKVAQLVPISRAKVVDRKMTTALGKTTTQGYND